MLRTTVPEATVDEYGDFRAGEDDIQIDAFDTAMKPESQTFRMQGRAKSEFCN
jgi:hypothetical protein